MLVEPVQGGVEEMLLIAHCLYVCVFLQPLSKDCGGSFFQKTRILNFALIGFNHVFDGFATVFS